MNAHRQFQFLLLLLASSACDSGVSLPVDQEVEELVAPFRTDSLSYTLNYRPMTDHYTGGAEWAVTYHNRSDSTVFFVFQNTCGVYLPPNCGSWEPSPLFERLTAGSWIPAMGSARLAVGTDEVHPVAAGDSLELPHELTFHGRDFQFNTDLPTDSIPGTYRLRYQVYSNPGPDERGPRENDLLSTEDRVSNEFRLTVPALSNPTGDGATLTATISLPQGIDPFFDRRTRTFEWELEVAPSNQLAEARAFLQVRDYRDILRYEEEFSLSEKPSTNDTLRYALLSTFARAKAFDFIRPWQGFRGEYSVQVFMSDVEGKQTTADFSTSLRDSVESFPLSAGNQWTFLSGNGVVTWEYSESPNRLIERACPRPPGCPQFGDCPNPGTCLSTDPGILWETDILRSVTSDSIHFGAIPSLEGGGFGLPRYHSARVDTVLHLINPEPGFGGLAHANLVTDVGPVYLDNCKGCSTMRFRLWNLSLVEASLQN